MTTNAVVVADAQADWLDDMCEGQRIIFATEVDQGEYLRIEAGESGVVLGVDVEGGYVAIRMDKPHAQLWHVGNILNVGEACSDIRESMVAHTVVAPKPRLVSIHSGQQVPNGS